MCLQKFIRTIKLILILFLLLSACSSSPKLPGLITNDVVLALGDSLTLGVGATPTDSYPAVLEKLIGFKVINAGVSGNTTANAIERLPSLLETEKPALVILCIGGNDLLRRTPYTTVAENLKTLIRMIQGANASVLLLAMPSLSLTVGVPDFYEDIAEEFHVPVDLTLMRSLLLNIDYKSDQIHLNQKGYEAMAMGIAADLKKYGAIY